MKQLSRLVFVATCIATSSSAAQSITGLALDDSSHAPLTAATVRLVDRNGKPVAETRTDSTGLFYLAGPVAGQYHLVIRRSEGGAFRSHPVDLAADSTLQLSFAVPLLPPSLRAGPFDDDVTRPAALRPGNDGPRYPSSARDKRERGMVVSFFVVGPDGKPEMSTLHLIASTKEFERVVRDAIRRLRFFPAEQDGHKAAQVTQLSFGFGFGSEPIYGDVTIHATPP